MNKKSNIVKTILITSIISFVILFFVGLVIPWMSLYFYMEAKPDPLMPKIKYAEFPFTLVYNLNDKTITYNDTIVCDYTGVGWNEGNMKKYRIWDKHLKNEEEVILHRINDYEYVVLNTGCSAAYLMGDKENPSYSYGNVCANLVKLSKNKERLVSSLSKEELYNKYGIEIISFEIVPPIENSFIPVE